MYAIGITKTITYIVELVYINLIKKINFQKGLNRCLSMLNIGMFN